MDNINFTLCKKNGITVSTLSSLLIIFVKGFAGCWVLVGCRLSGWSRRFSWLVLKSR